MKNDKFRSSFSKTASYNYKDADFEELRNLLNFVPWDLAYDDSDMSIFNC